VVDIVIILEVITSVGNYTDVKALPHAQYRVLEVEGNLVPGASAKFGGLRGDIDNKNFLSIP
jgi:hypothetical protein